MIAYTVQLCLDKLAFFANYIIWVLDISWLPGNVESLEQQRHVSLKLYGSYHELVVLHPHHELHQVAHERLSPPGLVVSQSTNYSHPVFYKQKLNNVHIIDQTFK